MNDDDLKIIRAAKRGNEEAFSTLVKNYTSFVYRTAYGVVRNQTDAEDVAQDSFVKAHQALRRLRDERTFPSWLATITVRTAIDYVSRRERTQTITLDPERHATEQDVHSASDARLDVHQALDRLNPEQRTILVLREIQGFDYEELAQILDIPLGTVRSRLHHARAQLRLLLTNQRRGS